MVDQNTIQHWVEKTGAQISKESSCTNIVMTQSQIQQLVQLAAEYGAKKAIASEETQTLVSASTKLADDLHEIIANSVGVAGLHKNGDVADWESLMAGGQFEEWLSSLDEMDQVLADRLLNNTDTHAKQGEQKSAHLKEDEQNAPAP